MTDLIAEERRDPGDQAGINNRKQSPLPTVGLLDNGRYGRHTGKIDQCKEHQAESYQGREDR